jgi:hypothetical protein
VDKLFRIVEVVLDISSNFLHGTSSEFKAELSADEDDYA